eukprot:3951954-Pyramimonas_sp.AAC.1
MHTDAVGEALLHDRVVDEGAAALVTRDLAVDGHADVAPELGDPGSLGPIRRNRIPVANQDPGIFDLLQERGKADQHLLVRALELVARKQ